MVQDRVSQCHTLGQNCLPQNFKDPAYFLHELQQKQALIRPMMSFPVFPWRAFSAFRGGQALRVNFLASQLTHYK